MQISELLTATADRLELRGAWIKGAVALNDQGDRVTPRSDSATCWCLDGCLRSFTDDRTSYVGAVYHLHAVGIFPSTVMFNDHDDTTQTMVVAACRQAATNAVNRGW